MPIGSETFSYRKHTHQTTNCKIFLSESPIFISYYISLEFMESNTRTGTYQMVRLRSYTHTHLSTGGEGPKKTIFPRTLLFSTTFSVKRGKRLRYSWKKQEDGRGRGETKKPPDHTTNYTKHTEKINRLRCENFTSDFYAVRVVCEIGRWRKSLI